MESAAAANVGSLMNDTEAGGDTLQLQNQKMPLQQPLNPEEMLRNDKMKIQLSKPDHENDKTSDILNREAITVIPPPSPALQSHPAAGTAVASSSSADIPSICSSSFNEDREFDFLKVTPIARSSSLKSQKNPASSARRKSVRFADALGLDLELVKYILNADEPPNLMVTTCDVIQSFSDPQNTDEHREVCYWRPCFLQPITLSGLIERVFDQKVLLENCVVNNMNLSLYGTVRVDNIAFEKHVNVRYTFNGWLTFDDSEASYIQHSNDLSTDRFAFKFAIPHHLGARSRLEFVIMFCAGGQVFWDNNRQKNYALECVQYIS